MDRLKLAITMLKKIHQNNGEKMLRLSCQKKDAGISIRKTDGFSIVELLVAMAISLLVLASVYSVFRSQQKSTVVREQVNMMQQNLRAGMTVMTRDIRMAGYVHPTITANAGITEASADAIEFTRLKDDLSLPLQIIRYNLDNGNLVRSVGDVGNPLESPRIIAEDIDALDFVYLDADGAQTANLGDIRSIQVTMVARTGRGDQGYVDTNTYENQVGPLVLPDLSNPPNDNFRRRILSREILCRNLF
jgi:type IV pilus assembly protein PilW